MVMLVSRSPLFDVRPMFPLAAKSDLGPSAVHKTLKAHMESRSPRCRMPS